MRTKTPAARSRHLEARTTETPKSGPSKSLIQQQALPEFPRFIQNATPCELKFEGVRVEMVFPEEIAQDLESFNSHYILSECWGRLGRKDELYNPNNPSRESEGRRTASERWQSLLRNATWRSYGDCFSGITTSIEYTFFLEDWENLSRLADYLKAPTETFIAGVLFHAAGITKGDRDKERGVA